MDEKQRKKTSKFLSLVLRHDPSSIGLTLTDSGWVSVDNLLSALGKANRGKVAGQLLTRDQLDEIVRLNDKQRFEFNDDGTQIRARQGHSLDVSLGYEATEPPEELFHGTPVTAVDSIRESGLMKQQRHDVHLHQNEATAKDVAGRRGKPVLLIVRAKAMHEQGFEFFVTENGVWLTDHVPVEFIEFPE